MTTKEWIQSTGVVLVAVGFGCFPLGYGVSPKRDTSLFNNFADLGAFVKYGLTLLTLGATMMLLSFLMPRDKGE